MSKMISLTKIGAVWECPGCGQTTHWTYAELVDCGGPVCHLCDRDMKVNPRSGYIVEVPFTLERGKVDKDGKITY